ncbi:TetR/AcrR family transcriptional regulator [Cohnella boryungensis]|uniref:TetR/AcrR family transcriptional regulator n=1 Tax=Cohnella boryungensis TaxID=768479 RepID=A0ABV8S9A6_9BACL
MANLVSRQEQRSEETKASILRAAGLLFSMKGYDAVTMREIAKEAGCSHTTIYIYFKDKEALLQQLSLPPLQSLSDRVNQLTAQNEEQAKILEDLSLAFIDFCFTHRNLYQLFFNVKAGRVDEPAPEMEINRTRNELFGQLSTTVQGALRLDAQDRRLLSCSRIYFFMLHGIISTYAHSEETAEELLARLTPTFRSAFRATLRGLAEAISNDSIEL